MENLSIFEQEENRILRVPKVDYIASADKLAPIEMAIRRDGAPKRIKLFELQKAALLAVAHAKGAAALLKVGGGKTYVGLLSGAVLGAENVTILCPKPAVDQMYREYHTLSKEFHIPPTRVLSIGAIQTQSGEERLLQSLLAGKVGKKCLVIDEAHQLLNIKAARTTRVIRVVAEVAKRMPINIVILSGTLTNAKLEKLTHLFAMVLGNESPLPIDRRVARVWGSVVDHDADCEPADCVKLMKLIRRELPTFSTKDTQSVRLSAARQAVIARHLASAKGVVKNSETEVVGTSISLNIVQRLASFENSQVLKKVYEIARDKKVIPLSEFLPGEEDLLIGGAADFARNLSQISLGYSYYYTDFGENKNRWIACRNQWKRAVRFELEERGDSDYDTELKVQNELARKVKNNVQPNTSWERELLDSYREWKEVERLESPTQKVFWYDTAVIEDMIERAKKLSAFANEQTAADYWKKQGKDPRHCSIWYRHLAVADELKRRDITTYYSGQAIEEKAGEGKLAAFSIRAHATALNLQHLHIALLLEPTSNATAMQQWFGRFLRVGQLADELSTTILAHTPILWKKVKESFRQAETEKQKGEQQYLLLATTSKVSW